MATQLVAPRSPGRGLTYEARPIAASNHAPQSLLGQGNAGRPATVAQGTVEGFADQVPLSIAMQQVLPQGYGYTLSQGVNAGQLVSWRGGRSWQSVLNDMLATAGLGYNVNGQLVTVSNMNFAPTVIGGAPALQTATPPVSAYAAPTGSRPPQVRMPDTMMGASAPGTPALMGPVNTPDRLQPAMVPNTMMPAPMMMGAPMASAPMMYAPMAAPMMDGSGMMMAGGMPSPYTLQNPSLLAPQSWEARPGQTLRTLLQDWCARAGTELNWQAEYDYPVMASFNMAGTFEEAVRTLLSGFQSAKPIPYGRLHYNPAVGQSILIVEASGNHYGE